MEEKEVKLYEIEKSLNAPLALSTCYCSNLFDHQFQDEGNILHRIIRISWQTVRQENESKKIKFMNLYLSKNDGCRDVEDIILAFPCLKLIREESTAYDVCFNKSLNTELQTPMRLIFVAWMPGNDCSENYGGFTGMSQHGYWQESWPAHLSTDTLRKILPQLLHHYPIQHEGIILVKLLDSYLQLQVDLEDEDPNQVYRYDHSVPLDLVIDRNYMIKRGNKIMSSSFRLKKVSYDFQALTKQRIYFNLGLSPERAINSSSRLLHHSILISSPHGSGKTFFLQQLQQELLQYEGPVSLDCLYCDANSINTNIEEILLVNERMSGSLSSFSSSRSLDFERSLSFILLQLFQTTDPSLIQRDSRNNLQRRLVLIIDNLDAFYQPFKVDYNANSSTYLPYYLDQYFRLIAYHLQVITSYMKDEPSSHESRNSIHLIGATYNSFNEIPKSSVGCFDMELFVSLSKPSFKDRCLLSFEAIRNLFPHYHLEIFSDPSDLASWMEEEIEVFFRDLDQHTNQMSAVELNNYYLWSYRIAGLTQGFLPGDLMQVMKKVLFTVQTNRKTEQRTDGKGQPKGSIFWEYFTDSISSTPLKAIEELEILHNYDQSTESLDWSSFVGYEESIKQLNFILSPLLKSYSTTTNIETLQSNTSISSKQSLLQQYRFPKGIIIHGPSGCGKTFLSKIISKQLNANLITIQSSDILSKYFGDSEAKIRKIFQIANQIAPCVLFFDEFDSLAYKREAQDQSLSGGGGGGGESSHGNIYNRILSTFLNELDGITQSSTSVGSQSFVLLIVACRSVDVLDEALVRPGRLQYHIHLDYPTVDDIDKILHRLLSPYQFCLTKNHLKQISQLPTVTISLLQEIVEKMKLLAIKEHIRSNDVKPNETQIHAILHERHWQDVLQAYLPSTSFGESRAFKFSAKFEGNFNFHTGI